MRNHYGKRKTGTSQKISRREFLQAVGMVTAGSFIASCKPQTSTIPAPTFDGPRPLVALAQASSYDPKLVREQVQGLFEGLGGLKDIVGDKVALKVNLTNGVRSTPISGVPSVEYHITHPAVVRAVGELLLDAGAKEIYIVEGVWDNLSFPLLGYVDVAQSLNASLVNLNEKPPYTNFAALPVGEDWYIYEKFICNQILAEVDTFVSIAKLKCHCSAGVTLAMKNLIGITPLPAYKVKPDDYYRTSLHGDEEGHLTRIPRIIVDLNRARPIHLAVLDGIATSEGGEGPWNVNTAQVKPGVLLAGKNALATDAIGTSVMGFDPTTEAPDEPFLQSDNYLNLAAQRGLGTNRLEMIDTVGVKPADVRCKFAACTEW